MQRSFWRSVLIITLIALGIRLVWGLSQLSLGTTFVEDGDYALYIIGAQDFLSRGDFSNSLYLIRPPAFPLLIVLLGLNNWAVLMVDCVLGALLTPLTYVLARQLRLSHGVALAAGLIVAVDPLTVRYTAFLGPEPLAFVSALAMMICLVAVARASSLRGMLLWGIGAAVMLLISVYARPAIYIVWLPLVILLLMVNRRCWPGLLVYVIISLAGMQVWVEHNARVFQNPTFSTVGPYAMAYYRATSVANLATDMSVDEVELDIARRVEAKLGHDPSLADENTKHSYLAASPAVERALNEVSMEIFRQYPLTYLATIPVGFVRLFQLSPPFDDLFNWRDYPVVAWNWLLLLVGVYGMYRAARDRRWLLFWSILLLFGYFTGGTLISKSAGLSGRERTIVFPFMALACAYGAAQLWQWWQARRASDRRNMPPPVPSS